MPADDKAFTPREQQTFDLLQQGYSNKDAAKILGVSLDAVKVYVSRLLEKTGASTRLQLVTDRRTPEQHDFRLRDLKIRQCQLKHQLAAVEEEIELLNGDKDETETVALDLGARVADCSDARC